MSKDKETPDSGEKNMANALSGDTDLLGGGATADQIIAMGGEPDPDLDQADLSAEDRGDLLEEDKPEEEDRGDEVKDDKEEGEEKEESEEEEAKEEEDDEEESEESDEEEAKEEEDDEEESEESDEEEEGEEEEEEEQPAKKEAKKTDDNRIPKSRFDEVNARRKAAEDELARLKAEQSAEQSAEKDEYDFDAAEEEHAELVLSGKVKDAVAKRREIRAAEQAMFEAKVAETSNTTVKASEVERELNKRVAYYEGKYDVFDKNSDNFSEDMVKETLAYYNGFLLQDDTLSHAEAFDIAVDTTVRLYGLKETGSEETGESTTPKKKTVKKKKRETKKKTELANRAPKNPTGKAGSAGDAENEAELDVAKMTDAEFDALPESTQARLRGDVF